MGLQLSVAYVVRPFLTAINAIMITLVCSAMVTISLWQLAGVYIAKDAITIVHNVVGTQITALRVTLTPFIDN